VGRKEVQKAPRPEKYAIANESSPRAAQSAIQYLLPDNLTGTFTPMPLRMIRQWAFSGNEVWSSGINHHQKISFSIQAKQRIPQLRVSRCTTCLAARSATCL